MKDKKKSTHVREEKPKLTSEEKHRKIHRKKVAVICAIALIYLVIVVAAAIVMWEIKRVDS